MNKILTIQKSISIFLLCLFTISITPVILIHNLVANHKDGGYGNVNQQGHQYSKGKINCHCIDFVAESPFINVLISFDLNKPQTLPAFNFYYSETFFPQYHFFIEQRGPPAFI